MFVIYGPDVGMDERRRRRGVLTFLRTLLVTLGRGMGALTSPISTPRRSPRIIKTSSRGLVDEERCDSVRNSSSRSRISTVVGIKYTFKL